MFENICPWVYSRRDRKGLTDFKYLVTTNQKHRVDSQKQKGEYKHKIKQNHQIPKRILKTNKKNVYVMENQLEWKVKTDNQYLFIFTLYVNALNAPIKWYRVAEWIK